MLFPSHSEDFLEYRVILHSVAFHTHKNALEEDAKSGELSFESQKYREIYRGRDLSQKKNLEAIEKGGKVGVMETGSKERFFFLIDKR